MSTYVLGTFYIRFFGYVLYGTRATKVGKIVNPAVACTIIVLLPYILTAVRAPVAINEYK